MSNNITGGQEAQATFYKSKFPVQEARQGFSQSLVSNATLTAANGIISKNMGNPVFVDIFLTATAASTFAISHSKDGNKFYHDTTNDVVFAGAGDKIVRVFGAPFIKIQPTVDNPNAFVDLIAKY